MTRVLVAADDVRVRRALEVNLLASGYEVDQTSADAASLPLALLRHPDAVILELASANAAGIRTIRMLRDSTTASIVVLLAKDGEASTVEVLDVGADDVLISPVGVEELFARLRATMRRTAPMVGPVLVETADFTVDLVGGEVRRGGEVVSLTPTEWQIVAVLARNAGHVVSHDQLLSEAMGSNFRREVNSLRVYMTQIRHKLEPEPSRPRYFITEPGVGVRFQPRCGGRVR